MKSARADGYPPGHGWVRFRCKTGLTGEQYVTVQGWRNATLVRCPHHPGGGCSLARHGTYRRKTSAGVRIARRCCPESHTTFSLLPDCLAARLPGTLADSRRPWPPPSGRRAGRLPTLRLPAACRGRLPVHGLPRTPRRSATRSPLSLRRYARIRAEVRPRNRAVRRIPQKTCQANVTVRSCRYAAS